MQGDGRGVFWLVALIGTNTKRSRCGGVPQHYLNSDWFPLSEGDGRCQEGGEM